MKEWKYEVGDILINPKAKTKIIITGKKTEECCAGEQRFYYFYQIGESEYNPGITTQAICIAELPFEEFAAHYKNPEDKLLAALAEQLPQRKEDTNETV